MTNEQINIAIAEACGWTACVFVESIKLAKGFPPPNNPPIYGTYENGMAQLPDYCNDLNAIHEAEKRLLSGCPLRDWMCYCECLTFMLGKSVYASVHATARDRAEAFLRTLGKWEGAK